VAYVRVQVAFGSSTGSNVSGRAGRYENEFAKT